MSNKISSVKERILENISNLQNKERIFTFALDGINYDVAKCFLDPSEIICLKSSIPSTSATSWLSSIIGVEPKYHHIPGYAFRSKTDNNLSLFYNRTLRPKYKTLFEDMMQMFDIKTMSDFGDFKNIQGPWFNYISRGSDVSFDLDIYNNQKYDNLLQKLNSKQEFSYHDDLFLLLKTKIERKINKFLEQNTHRALFLLIDLDIHIHRFGYDFHIGEALKFFNSIFRQLQTDNHYVIAYSDHGLTKTYNCSKTQEIIQHYTSNKVHVGGAGRMRWVYSDNQDLFLDLKEALEPNNFVVLKQKVFHKSIQDLIGDIVIIAKSEAFISDTNYTYDHGGLSLKETLIPFCTYN